MRSRRPNPQPLEVDAVKVVTFGTALWGLALLACLPNLSTLAEDDHLWWVQTAAVGFGLGLLGIWVCRRRRAKLRRGDAPAGRPPATGELPPPLA